MIGLDACSAGDLDDFLALALDARVTARIGDGTPWGRETAVARFRHGLASCERGEGLWFLARDGGEVVGLVLGELDHLAEIEVGVWLAPDHWGQGHGRALLGLLLPMVRLRLPGVVPTAYANVDHAASAAMLRAAGFADDGTLIGRYGTEVTRFVARTAEPE
ncbi:GNAT family N-acetyltransferase [Pseudonocardia abyssalis]|uniref:GNAT family N-acetyltransferase n=1 Tax=Pseudonocardia abyssalis TaxID=2792008 RepID=A0ABS6UX05_9PSEU|nr:GNAT family N-acetyltransferase [Pseudonocardia abyssalis]MBW0116725.1 GNAT family N-acetyltransferase [Pseudonocardia abyssalis]MBW0136808.1 GNAT family N-acetyltransferase [Pseudonocardia abyssalis]